ncbi:hypothetical protein GCM10020256_16770 [Streptomyces thermocoprophilus]
MKVVERDRGVDVLCGCGFAGRLIGDVRLGGDDLGEPDGRGTDGGELAPGVNEGHQREEGEGPEDGCDGNLVGAQAARVDEGECGEQYGDQADGGDGVPGCLLDAAA